MAEEGILDLAHVSFLDMIKSLIATSGAASAKGTLIRNALGSAASIQPVVYGSFDEFLAAVGNGGTSLTLIEGRANHMGSFVFGLPHCPFAASIRNYKRVFGTLPAGYAEFTAEFNKPGPITDRYRVGEGAGVSPFCAIHQTMRSAIAERIKLGDKEARVYQLGCKSGSGQKGFAQRWITESGVPQDVVDKVLDDHMCCYAVMAAG